MAEPDWLRLQKKIFGRYVSQKLRQSGIKTWEIKDIVKDVSDGLLIIDLVEVLSGKSYPEKKPKPSKSKIQSIDNCNKALEFSKSCGIKTQASPEDLVEGHEKLVLGMLFQIIIKYMKFEDDEDSGGDVKEALMLWLKNKTAGYSNVNLENFTKSFHDGLAFCALIHRMRPKLLNYDSLSKADKIGNLTLALDIGAKYCNVEKYLEPEDISKLDEVSMIVYLSDWYYGVALLQKQDISAKRIGKLVLMTELHDKMRAEYTSGASAFVQWVDNKIKELNNHDFDNTLAGVQKKLDQFYEYKAGEKSKQLTSVLDLESLFDNLSLRLVNNNRPPYNPGDHLLPAALNAKIVDLEKAELEKSRALHTELDRQIKLHNQAKKFKAGTESLKSFLGEKDAYFSASESIDTVEAAEIALDVLEVHITETNNANTGRFKSLKEISAHLYAEKFEGSNEIKSIESGIESTFSKLAQAGESKKKNLQDSLAQQLAINDQLCKDMASVVKSFQDWLQTKKTKIAGNKSEELEKQLADLISSSSDDGVADSKLSEIAAAEEKVKARSITNNPHTNLTRGDCAAQWSHFGLVYQKKKELLENQIEEKKKAGLTEEQLQEIKDNFVYFDKDKTGFLEKKELRACLQSLGEDSTPKDVQNVLSIYDKDGDGKVSKSEFEAFMKTKLGDTNSKEEILQAFQYLSFEKSVITEDNLVTVINDISWKQRHVDYLKKEMKPKDGGLDYPTWTEEVFAR